MSTDHSHEKYLELLLGMLDEQRNSDSHVPGFRYAAVLAMKLAESIKDLEARVRQLERDKAIAALSVLKGE